MRNRNTFYPTVSQSAPHGLAPMSMSGEVTTRDNNPIMYTPCGGSGNFYAPVPDDFARPHVAPFNAMYMQNRTTIDQYQDMTYPKSSRDLVVPPVIGGKNLPLDSRVSPTSIDPRLYRLRTYMQVGPDGTAKKSNGTGDFID